MDDNDKYVVTVGRQFGSGGRELGRLLADRLGIAYYDKELLLEAARNAGVAPEVFERSDEKFPKFLSGILSFNMGVNPMSFYCGPTSISDDSIYRAQSEFIASLARKCSCVIVGRTADYVLREHPRCVNIFVHAPLEERIKRIMTRGDRPSAEQARALTEKTNKLRANYYNFYTDKRWGAAESYDLTIDSSSMPMTDVVEVVRAYLQRRLNLK